MSSANTPMTVNISVTDLVDLYHNVGQGLEEAINWKRKLDLQTRCYGELVKILQEEIGEDKMITLKKRFPSHYLLLEMIQEEEKVKVCKALNKIPIPESR